MELKAHELLIRGQEDLGTRLSEINNPLSWRDVLDESDELLHHRYRLIYATGAVEKLHGGPDRYKAAQILLDRTTSCDNVKKFIEQNKVTFLPITKKNQESRRNLRINSKTMTESLACSFHEILFQSIIDSPPYGLEWLKDHPESERMKDFAVNPRTSMSNMKGLGLTDNRIQSLLAFRGFLAGRILLSCLEKRHRVSYGIARPGKKRIAVPFRGADTPAERSEYQHPDVAIMLTCLSYYEDGLNEDELCVAFSELLSLARESKRKQYKDWFDSSLDMMKEKRFDHSSIETIEKIDLTNAPQFQYLAKFFSHNRPAVNFWLNTCVFPDEMQHYPYRMTATSWDLAEKPAGGWLGGFSGTNDNHRVLPLQVRQYFTDPSTEYSNPETENIWRSLMGTNGLMIDSISRHTLGCHELASVDPVDEILQFITNYHKPIHALIDCGALLAGISRSKVASRLLDGLTSELRGVTFFDRTEWKIMEKDQRTLPKNESPVHESDSFAFYDEPRCRGSDLKLGCDAVAVVTLGPRLCRDKFMQAAGRLRKLGKNQKLVIVGTKEVMTNVRTLVNKTQSETISPLDIIEWTLRNTMDSVAEACLPWASQGLFHATSYGNPDLVIEEEMSKLEDMYGEAFVDIKAGAAVAKTKDHYINRRMERTQKTMSPDSQHLVHLIMEQSKGFVDISVNCTQGTDEECEREIELQREIEQEEEIQIPKVEPKEERDWELGRIFSARGPDNLPSEAGIQKVSKFVLEYLDPTSVSQMKWHDSVYGTENFFVSVSSEKVLNKYLRLVDAALFFPATNAVLFLSERESDLILERMYNSFGAAKVARGNFRVVLFHLMFSRTAADGNVKKVQPGALTMGITDKNELAPWNQLLPDSILASMQLFSGETVFPREQRQLELKKIICPGTVEPLSVREGRAMADMRGFSRCYPYSDLEKVCKEVEKEYESKSFVTVEKIDADVMN